MKSKIIKAVRVLLLVSAIACMASVAMAGFHYTHTDPRFSVRQIRILGLKRVDEDDVMSRVQLRTESNTNIFAVDMEDIRQRVEQIQWVRYAFVQRAFPDQIIIRVIEREPIGLARIQGHVYAFDAEGAILEPDTSSAVQFPILDGLSKNDTDRNLAKIAMYNKVITELGEDGLSEIIVNPSNDVSVVREEDAFTVVLGVEDFKERWSRYMALREKINTDFKGAVRVDLRFRNKVIVTIGNDDDGGKVIWDGKKKSL